MGLCSFYAGEVKLDDVMRFRVAEIGCRSARVDLNKVRVSSHGPL